MTLKAGIFGYPIAHSISPAMHQAAFDHLGLNARYEPWETPPESLSQGVDRLRDETYLGANVTVPHKRDVMHYLDEVDDLAGRIGAVNTVINDRGRLSGTNTDVFGFLHSLKEEADLDPSGLDVVLVGAGGAARAAAYALATAGIGSFDRSESDR